MRLLIEVTGMVVITAMTWWYLLSNDGGSLIDLIMFVIYPFINLIGAGLTIFGYRTFWLYLMVSSIICVLLFLGRVPDKMWDRKQYHPVPPIRSTTTRPPLSRSEEGTPSLLRPDNSVKSKTLSLIKETYEELD